MNTCVFVDLNTWRRLTFHEYSDLENSQLDRLYFVDSLIMKCYTEECSSPSPIGGTKIKYLGVIVDQHVRWKEHILYSNKHIGSIIQPFHMLASNLPRANLVMLYESVAESVLRYCIEASGNAADTTSQNNTN